MTRTLPITDDDVAAVVRLLGDIAGMTDPLDDRRRRLMVGLCQLTDADTWMWVASRVRDGRGATFYLMDGGWASEAERTAVWHANVQPDVYASVTAGLDLARHQTFTYDPAHSGWGDGSVFRRHIAPTGVHHLLLSLYPLDAADSISGIGVHRRAARLPFTPREVALVHLIVGQVGWLHRAGTDVPANTDALYGLTPRQREVLVHLLGGDTRKRVAAKLGIAPHTVGEHIDGLYRTLGVATRPELMARFLPGQRR